MTPAPFRPYLWMLVGCVCFSVMAILAHSLKEAYDWQVIAFARSVLPMLLALVLAKSAGAQLLFLKPGVLWIRSIAGSLSMMCTFYALLRMPVSDVFTLTNIFPIWVAILSWPLLGEKPELSVWVSALLGVAGVYFVMQPSLNQGNYAIVSALAASLFTAVAMLGLHRLQHLDARAIVVHFSGVAIFFACACFFLFEHQDWSEYDFSRASFLTLLAMGVVATAGQLCLTKAFATGNPARISVVGLTQILFTMLLEVIFESRAFTLHSLIGTVLVVVPTAWVMLHAKRASRLPPPDQD